MSLTEHQAGEDQSCLLLSRASLARCLSSALFQRTIMKHKEKRVFICKAIIGSEQIAGNEADIKCKQIKEVTANTHQNNGCNDKKRPRPEYRKKKSMWIKVILACKAPPVVTQDSVKPL